MTKLPSMPFFPADFFADTEHLTRCAAHGYLFLLGHAWLRGAKLPNDDVALARMAGVRGDQWKKIKPEIMEFWKLGPDGCLTNSRLTKEWSWVEGNRTRNKLNGALGGRPKYLKSNIEAKPNGLFSKTGVKAPTPTPIKKESLNGILGQKRESRHFVQKGTPQWNAWVVAYQRSHGKPPLVILHYETREKGMFFPTEWPPSES
jgi:uncharacterized protein YdaU (DUF1376 family)